MVPSSNHAINNILNLFNANCCEVINISMFESHEKF